MWKRTLCLSAVLGVGCGDAQNAPVGEALEPRSVETITAADIAALEADERLVIDTRDTSVAYELDQSLGPIPFGRIVLMCPDGSPMPLDRWAVAREADWSISGMADFGWLRLQAVDPIAEEAGRQHSADVVVIPTEDPDCDIICELCEDGLWVCFNECEAARERARRELADERMINYTETDDPREGRPPPPSPPTGETGGTEGGSGSGGVGGGRPPPDGGGSSGGGGGRPSGSSGGSPSGGGGSGGGGLTNPPPGR